MLRLLQSDSDNFVRTKTAIKKSRDLWARSGALTIFERKRFIGGVRGAIK